MEVFNRLVTALLLAENKALTEELAARHMRGLRDPGCKRPFHSASELWTFLDFFDMTFPFHYDNLYSDGGHYGRWGDPRSEMVDRMQVQVLLNGLCEG